MKCHGRATPGDGAIEVYQPQRQMAAGVGALRRQSGRVCLPTAKTAPSDDNPDTALDHAYAMKVRPYLRHQTGQNYDLKLARPIPSYAYDPSAVIRPQNTTPVRPPGRNPYDANSAKSTTRKKCVTSERKIAGRPPPQSRIV
jgi:hypothetical protein